MAAGESVALLGLFDHPGPKLKLGWRDLIPAITNRLSSSLRRIKRSQSRMGASRGAAPPAPAPARASSRPDLFEHNLHALLNYVVKPYPGRVTLFRARDGSPRIHSDPFGGWGDIAAGGVEIVEVPGNHNSMLEQPHVVALGEAISHCIARIHVNA
jgi:thioesterase domain-containing protein